VKRLLLATTNAGKLRELRALVEPRGIQVVSPADFPGRPALTVEETGSTFEDNARLKARAYAAHYGLPALADDSGLAVDALGGAPGVRSARYAGDGASDAGNIRKLLDALKDIPDGSRGAAFVCVLCLARPDGTDRMFRGECRGLITRQPKGDGGFGYDPVFEHPDFGGRTFAEISPAEKNSVSHRGAAMTRLTQFLRDPDQTGQTP